MLSIKKHLLMSLPKYKRYSKGKKKPQGHLNPSLHYQKQIITMPIFNAIEAAVIL